MKSKVYEKVAERDNYQCRVCGNNQIQIHHIVFRSHGGKDTPENLIALCFRCHAQAHSNEKSWRSWLFDLQADIYGRIEKDAVKAKNKWE